MARKSTILVREDVAGEYQVEIFGCEQPKSVVVCVHGRGVHREDGEDFFYAVAEQYPDYAFILVDQNQFDGDTCLLSPLQIALDRVQGAIDLAKEKYANMPIVLLGHSMGCGVITRLKLDDVAKIIFVAPTAGTETKNMLDRYGKDIANGKLTVSVDGLKKYWSKEYVESVNGIVWADEYRKLLARFKPVYVFESEQEEIVGEERFGLRDMPFTRYEIIPGATHNLHGSPLQLFFGSLDKLL